MAEHLKDTTLTRTLADVVGDLADLFQKEVRLARAELSEKFSVKLRAGIWMAVAGLFGFLTCLLIVQAIVFAIASSGVALHWAVLLVGAGCALMAGAAFIKGRADASEELTPTRTLQNVKQDIAIAKEQLT